MMLHKTSCLSEAFPVKGGITARRSFSGRFLSPGVLSSLVLSALVPAGMGLLLPSCEKPAGPGGKASISGQVVVRSFDRKFRVLQSVYPAADEDVYILYGSSGTISDDRTTSPEGKFEFKYLSKGDYTVYVYSKDSTGSSESGEVAIRLAVSLSSNSQEADLGRINIYKTLDVDEGKALLRGLVRQVTYSKDFNYIVDTIPGQDLDVFLVYEDDPDYFDRIRTLPDGTFAFPDLIKGDYTVFVYSENTNRSPEMVPVIKNISVDELRGEFDAGVFFVAREL